MSDEVLASVQLNGEVEASAQVQGAIEASLTTPQMLAVTLSTYIHEQAEAAAEWNIAHNLNRYPSVTVVDSADNVVTGYITYVDRNNVKITFNGAFKGRAFLN